ncbi:serine/threonine-protein kinase [Dictyobacter arantiisoli]|uniref:non-specific serine/threonine protein kinase n=1 Tax=Dictyobacter arantiisoli TaxID=2014874 RepID=A0A5A5TBF3_9CHLR|nr:serine/threonine-protein kinase [Dictyobacter arantiisoli]GCF08820.1 hypothetical protein KDI_23840 [Dictyobacter arantiisoli]
MKEELLGKQLASYLLIQVLGQGAFGSVYLGKHFLLAQKPPVAIKILNTALNSQEEIDRFFQEAVILDALSHPHILSISDANLYEGYPFFVAEYAPGGSLRDHLDRLNGAPMPLEDGVRVLQQVGDGLQHAHDLDIVHRDLKPANILFDANGDALLADFGIALQIQKTRRVDEIGTPAYMSPEQFKGKISKKSDQYALGCIAYEIFTGQQLFIADDPYTIGYKHIYEQPIAPRDLNPAISLELATVILKALAKERDDRYENVSDFIQALQDAATQVRPAQGRASSAVTSRTGKHPATKTNQGSAPENDMSLHNKRGTTPANPHVNLPPFLQKQKQKPQTQSVPSRTVRPAQAQHTSSTRQSVSQIRPLWATTSGSAGIFYSASSVTKGIIYAGTYSDGTRTTASPRHLRALDAATGEHLWSYKNNAGIHSAPVITQGIVYFCSGNVETAGKICALDADTGEIYWSVETDELLQDAPIVTDDIVYAHSQHTVYAVNAATGQEYWNVTLKAALQGHPMIADNAVYITSARGHCYVVDSEHGQKLATFSSVGHLHAAFPHAESIVCLFSLEDQLYAIDMQTGETYWTIRIEQPIVHDIEITAGIAYISLQGTFPNSAAHTRILAIDVISGDQIWVANLRSEIDATPLAVDGIVYLVTQSQELYLLDALNGKLILAERMGLGKLSRPSVANNTLFITDSEINAYQLV